MSKTIKNNQKQSDKSSVFCKIKNKAFYSLASIKNRYPCKLIDIKFSDGKINETIITYQAVTKLNIRSARLKDILDDRVLAEKFHPMDCIRLGFLAAGEIMLFESENLDEADTKFHHILHQLFSDLSE